MFEKEFAAAGFDVSKVQWTNLFRRSEGQAGIEQDYEKHHNEDSVNSAGWLDKLVAEMTKTPTFEMAEWSPNLTIVMED